MSTPPRPSTSTPTTIPSTNEIDKRKLELFGSTQLARPSSASSELVIHKSPAAVIAIIEDMANKGDFSPVQTFGSDIVTHLSAVSSVTAQRLIEQDKQASESNIGKTSTQLAALSDDLNFEKLQAPGEPLVKALGLTKAVDSMIHTPFIGAILRKLVRMPAQDKITKVVENIKAMMDKREPMIESLYNTKDNLSTSAFTTLELMRELEAGSSVLNDRITGAKEINLAIQERASQATDPIEKKKYERLLNAGSRMERGLNGVQAVTIKTQLQAHTSVQLNEELTASISEAIQVLPAVMDTGAVSLMTTTAGQRAAEELTAVGTATTKLLRASDIATAHTLKQAEELSKKGIIDVEELKNGIRQLVSASQRIRALQTETVANTRKTSDEIGTLNATLQAEIAEAGAVAPDRIIKKEIKDSGKPKDKGVIDI